jgi:hypothetical protein
MHMSVDEFPSGTYEYASSVSKAILATVTSVECVSFFNLATRDQEEMKLSFRIFIMGGLASGPSRRVRPDPEISAKFYF